jgi:hypothetical protein
MSTATNEDYENQIAKLTKLVLFLAEMLREIFKNLVCHILSMFLLKTA